MEERTETERDDLLRGEDCTEEFIDQLSFELLTEFLNDVDADKSVEARAASCARTTAAAPRRTNSIPWALDDTDANNSSAPSRDRAASLIASAIKAAIMSASICVESCESCVEWCSLCFS